MATRDAWSEPMHRGQLLIFIMERFSMRLFNHTLRPYELHQLHRDLLLLLARQPRAMIAEQDAQVPSVQQVRTALLRHPSKFYKDTSDDADSIEAWFIHKEVLREVLDSLHTTGWALDCNYWDTQHGKLTLGNMIIYNFTQPSMPLNLNDILEKIHIACWKDPLAMDTDMIPNIPTQAEIARCFNNLDMSRFTPGPTILTGQTYTWNIEIH